MISTTALELRAGARLLVSGVNVRINHGDRIGFVGRNGAGKSTLAKVLAGENLPAGGGVQRTGKIGYLPQDPRTGEDQGTALDRILSARDLDQIAARMAQVEEEMNAAFTPVSFNFGGAAFVNQHAAFSDFHVTGGNPSGNASFTDAQYVNRRFVWVGNRRMS